MENNQQYKWRQRKKRNTRITVWVLFVILLSVGGTFVYEGMKESDPLRVAENYFAEEAGNDGYKVEVGERSLNEQNQFVQEYTFSYTADGSEVSRTVHMVQQNEKKFGLFEQWVLTDAKEETRNLELIAPADSQVLINGIAPDAASVKEDENLSPGAICYMLQEIPAENSKIQVNGLPFDSYEGTLDTTSSVIDIRTQLTVGENAQTQMLELGKSAIYELFTAAAENKTAEDLGELFADAANRENLFKAIKSNLYKDGVLQIKSLRFDGFEATFGDVYYPGKEEESYIGIEMTLSYNSTYELAESEGESETEEESESAESKESTKKTEKKEAVFYFEYHDGNCSISSIEVPGII